MPFGFINREQAQRISQQIDECAGACCRTVNGLVQLGLWKKVPDGFRILAFDQKGTRTRQEVEEKLKLLDVELASLEPNERRVERNFRIANFLYGISA